MTYNNNNTCLLNSAETSEHSKGERREVIPVELHATQESLTGFISHLLWRSFHSMFFYIVC